MMISPKLFEENFMCLKKDHNKSYYFYYYLEKCLTFQESDELIDIIFPIAFYIMVLYVA